MKRLRALLPLILLIGIGIAVLASGALDRFKPENLAAQQVSLQADIAANPVLAPLIHVVVLMLAISTGIPGAVVIILAGGMLFGAWYGALLSSIGVTLGALILFFASRAAFGDHTDKPAPALVERLRGGYHAHPVSYSFFLRLVPIFPFGGVTVTFAWMRCPIWLFTLATALGGSVMTTFESALGAGLAQKIAAEGKVDLNVFAEPGVIGPMLALAALALVPILIQRLRSRAAAPK